MVYDADTYAVRFIATFPPIQTAITVDGGGGARIKLDIPEDQLDAVMRLVALRDMVIEVTIRPAEAIAKQTRSKDDHAVSTWSER